MGDSRDIAIDYSNRLIFDEPELLVCDITDADIATMSLEDKLKVIADNMNQLRIEYESASVRINYSNRIIKIARDIHSIEYEGIGYFHMAIFFNASYKYYYRFKETMLQAVELLKNSKMYPALASAYTLLGVDANNYGQFNLNLDYYLLARQYAIMQNDPYIIALVHYFFCGFYILVNDLDTALEYGLKSVEYYEKNLDRNSELDYFGSDGMDMAYCMLGQCYIFKGQYDAAIDCYNKSMEREKLYTPRYDCPNTALLYAFHVMALHILSRYDERNAVVDEFISIMENNTPSPPFFLHIVNIVYYLIRIGEYESASRINKIMIYSGIDKDNPNFGLYISNIEIEIAKHYNDKERLSMAMGYFYDFYIKNNAYVLENLRRSTELRVEIDDIQKEKNELEVARAANLAKSNFLSNVSHEIRTPLNAILGMDELIMRETSEDAIYNYANDIKNAGNTLLGLINDILDSSKLDANKINIIAVEYDISSAINDLVNMVSQKAADKGLELKIDIDSSIPVFLYGDEIRIKQCALNILSNAIKYTEKGSVTLKVTSRLATSAEIDKASDLEYIINTEGQKLTLSEDKWHLEGGKFIILRFSITDTGIGIKEQDLKKLDIPFERIEEERNRNIEGTGLGMSIVRRLLEMMGSRLEVESIYGKGSTFSFEIMQGAHSDEVLGDYTVRYKQNQSNRKEFRIEYHAPKARLLIVDDTPANLTVAKGLLKPIGAQIDTADSGEETLRMVQENRYDILLIDHRMPGMDGIETLQALKNLENNLSKGAPCIALTANAISGAREMFLSEGFDDYLTKPIDSDKLVKLVRYYLPANLIIASSNNSDIDAIENNNSPDSRFASAKEKLATIPEIDVDAALESCGNDIEILINTMKDFAFSAKKQPDIIESYLSAGDIRNYTVQVHGLKSAARFVGAIALSKAAEHLEKCGDEGNITEIEQKTPQLITDFKTIVGHMDSAISEIEMDINDNIKDEAKDQPPKPVIDSSTLSEIYGGVKEFVSAHDYKSAENVLNMLSRYTVPEPDNSKVLEIRDMIRNVDHDGLLDIL